MSFVTFWFAYGYSCSRYIFSRLGLRMDLRPRLRLRMGMRPRLCLRMGLRPRLCLRMICVWVCVHAFVCVWVCVHYWILGGHALRPRLRLRMNQYIRLRIICGHVIYIMVVILMGFFISILLSSYDRHPYRHHYVHHYENGRSSRHQLPLLRYSHQLMNVMPVVID